MKMKKIFWIFGLCLAVVACNNKPQANELEQEEKESVAVVNPVALYSDSIAQDSTRADLYLMRAHAYMASEQIGSAMMDVNHAISLDSRYVDAYLMLADIYYMMGDNNNINVTLNRAAEIDPTDARPLVKLGELNLLQQNYTLSAAYIEKALKINTYNPKAYFVKGMYFIAAEQDTVNALKNFQLAYEQDGTFFDAAELIGRIYAVQQPPYALDFLRNMQRNFPNHPSARYELALYLQDHGAPQEAIAHYDTLLTLMPENFVVIYNKAYVNFVYLHENETALQLFDQALQLNPNYLDAMFNKGRVLEQMGRYADAASIYKEVLKRQDNYELAIEALNRVQNQAE